MDIDKVYIPLLPQGHKVKFKVTKVIAVFLPILLGFHLLGVLDCLPLVADTISLDMLVSLTQSDNRYTKNRYNDIEVIFSQSDNRYTKN